MAPLNITAEAETSWPRDGNTAFENLVRDYIVVHFITPIFDMIDIDHPGPIWRTYGRPVDAFMSRHIIPITVAMTAIGIIGLWRIYANEREMARRCHTIQRIMDKPSGPERDEVILDICVEINDIYDSRKVLEAWRGDYLMQLPGAEKHWEKKHPGKVRTKYRWAAGEEIRDKFDMRVLHLVEVK